MSAWPRLAATVLAMSASTWAFTAAAQAAPTLTPSSESGSSLFDQLHGSPPAGLDGFEFVAAPRGNAPAPAGGQPAPSEPAAADPAAADSSATPIDLSAATPWWSDRDVLAISRLPGDGFDTALPEVVLVPAPDGFHYGVAGLSLVAGLQAWRATFRRR
jgi:hypothetical protein